MKGYCRNEVLAREGIDTPDICRKSSHALNRRNEVLAREGIDTTTLNSNPHLVLCRNEVLAREGIDTIGNGICNHRRNQCVEMRY